MGAFSKLIFRSGFSTVYTPGTVTPSTASKITTQRPADIELTSGTGASQADIEWVSYRTLAASSNETIDLYGGLTDAFGVTLNFVKVKGIWIYAASANVNNVIFKPAAATSFLGPFGAAAHQVSIPPAGHFMVTAPVAGWAVTDSTDDIYFGNSGAGSSVIFTVHIVGTSA